MDEIVRTAILLNADRDARLEIAKRNLRAVIVIHQGSAEDRELHLQIVRPQWREATKKLLAAMDAAAYRVADDELGLSELGGNLQAILDDIKESSAE